jgi:ribulose-5-phosphate 4-epimerase/fuculose-1-phosphate aldolase
LERACQVQVLASSTGIALKPVNSELAARVMAQSHGERLQSELFFSSLRRTMG